MMLNETFRLTVRLNETGEVNGGNDYYLDRQRFAGPKVAGACRWLIRFVAKAAEESRGS